MTTLSSFAIKNVILIFVGKFGERIHKPQVQEFVKLLVETIKPVLVRVSLI